MLRELHNSTITCLRISFNLSLIETSLVDLEEQKVRIFTFSSYNISDRRRRTRVEINTKKKKKTWYSCRMEIEWVDRKCY